MTAFEIAFSVIKEERGKSDCHGVPTDTVQIVPVEKLQHLVINSCLSSRGEGGENRICNLTSWGSISNPFGWVVRSVSKCLGKNPGQPGWPLRARFRGGWSPIWCLPTSVPRRAGLTHEWKPSRSPQALRAVLRKPCSCWVCHLTKFKMKNANLLGQRWSHQRHDRL